MRYSARIPALTVMLLVVTLGILRVAGAPSAVAAGASLTLSPTSGPSGISVLVSGNGYQPGEELALSWHSESIDIALGSTVADSTGAFSGVRIVVPAVSPGTYSVWALGNISWVSATFRVTAVTPTPVATSTPTPSPTPTLSPTPTPTPAPGASTQQEVGPAGGDIIIGGGAAAGGVGVLFPPDALPGTVNVTVAYTNTALPNVTAPSGTVLIGKTIEVTPDRPIVLGKSVRIRVGLTAANLAGRPISTVRIGIVLGTRIELLPTRVVDAGAGIVEAEVDHFTKFSVTSATSQVPALTSPNDGATLADLGAALAWTNPPGTTQYHVQVVPFNGDGPGINLIRSAESVYNVPAPNFSAVEPNYMMLPDMTYTWRVRTTSKATFAPEDDPAWSAWSLRTFRTPAATSASITLAAPSEGSTVASLTPTLTWTNSNRSIFYYEVQLSKDPAFNANPASAIAAVYWELRHGAVTDPPNSYTVPAAFPLEPATQYHWRVRPRVQGDGAAVGWTPSATFRTP